MGEEREPRRPRRRLRKRLMLAAALLGAAALAVGVLGQLLGGSQPSSADATEPGSVETNQVTASAGSDREPAKLARDFTAETVDGTSFRLSAQRGEVVVFDFLQAYCPSCARQVPALERAAQRFAPQDVNVVIVDVSGLDNRELRDYYRDQLGLSDALLILRDRDFRIARDYEVSAIGMTFVVGRDGELRWQGLWEGDEDVLLPLIEAAAAS